MVLYNEYIIYIYYTKNLILYRFPDLLFFFFIASFTSLLNKINLMDQV